MFERFTDRARKVMALANQEAQRFNHEYIGTEHILLGLVKEGHGVGASALTSLGIDLRKTQHQVEKLLKSGPEMVTMGKLPQTPRSKKAIEYAIMEARNFGHHYVGSEHVLLGLLHEQNGVAAQVLLSVGASLASAREAVLTILSQRTEDEDGQPLESATSPHASRPPQPTFLRALITASDEELQALAAAKDESVRAADYDSASAARDAILALHAKRTAIQRLESQESELAPLLQNLLSQLKPTEPLTAANLLLALIHSDPTLAARLAPLLPEIDKACHTDPPAPNADPQH